MTADLPDSLFDEQDAPAEGNASVAPPPDTRRGGSVDAARHSVLRRLAPALKHDMVVNLQAVSMMAETLNARMERDAEGSDVQASISKLNRLAREAVLKCLKVSTWIDPGEDDTAPLHEAVQDCVTLMRNSFNFRGFTLVNEVQPAEFQVCRSAARNLLAASLITLSDTQQAPAQLVVSGELTATHAVLTVSYLQGREDAQRTPVEVPAVRIDWADIQALAADDGVELSRSPDHIVIRLPRAVPSTPLRMAPI